MDLTVEALSLYSNGVRDEEEESTLVEGSPDSIEVSDSVSQSGLPQQSVRPQQSNRPQESSRPEESMYAVETITIGTFHLDDSLPIRAIQKYANHICNEDLSNTEVVRMSKLLVFLACLKAAQQLWSSFWTVPVETDIFSEIEGLTAYLPETVDLHLIDLGDIETKFGRIKVRWPLTTFKTALVNAKLYVEMASFNEGTIGDFESNLVWNDDEGNEKLDYFIEKYWKLKFNRAYTCQKERFLPLPLNKNLTQEDIENGAGPQWFKDAYPECQDLLQLYCRRMAFDDASAEDSFQKIGLKRMSILDEELVDGLDTASYNVSDNRSFYDKYYLMNDFEPTGKGSPGQLYVAGRNDSTVSTALITSKIMSKDDISFGLAWTPAISFEIKNDLRMASRTTRSQATSQLFKSALRRR